VLDHLVERGPCSAGRVSCAAGAGPLLTVAGSVVAAAAVDGEEADAFPADVRSDRAVPDLRVHRSVSAGPEA
jgi:hypothetical protein